MKGKRGANWARRGAALLVSAAVLRGVYAGLSGGWLPSGSWGEARAAALTGALVRAETGAYDQDEPSLWTRLVTSELPLYAKEDAAETEEQSLPATDAVTEEPAPEPDPEEATEPATEEATPEESVPDDAGVIRETITANSNTLTGDGVELNNNTEGISVDPAALAASVLTQTIAPASEGAQILIMHTHGSEAYTMSGTDVYTESDTARTIDENYNMIRVGEEMKAVFEGMGFSVLHDTTLYDYPSYNGSYGRSLAGIQTILAENPSISVVLDVHRDALIAADGTVYKAVTQVDGADTAQVMLVVGTNDGGLTHPGWQDNLNLAAHIQLAMGGIEPTLCRPINLRSQRFNQHMTPCSLLVEVGTSGNTLQEALAGARNFAQAAGSVYQTLVTG